MMGGALGLAVLASLAAHHTGGLLIQGVAATRALNDGYQLAFAAGAACAVVSALLGPLLLRIPKEGPGESAPIAAV
jgi:hypothetical protein